MKGIYNPPPIKTLILCNPVLLDDGCDFVMPCRSWIFQKFYFHFQEKTREHYINIQDAEPEVLFIRERRSGEESSWFALRTLSGGYVGFDKRGKAKDPASVNPNQPEGQFVMNAIQPNEVD